MVRLKIQDREYRGSLLYELCCLVDLKIQFIMKNMLDDYHGAEMGTTICTMSTGHFDFKGRNES